MIVELFVDISQIPLYSLNGWSLYGTPIPNEGKQPMVKNIDIIPENDKEIVQFFMDRYWDDETMEKYVKALTSYNTIADVLYKLDCDELEKFEIIWR